MANIDDIINKTASTSVDETAHVIDDVAEAVLFLASSGARYITGQTMHVNGGMAMI